MTGDLNAFVAKNRPGQRAGIAAEVGTWVGETRGVGFARRRKNASDASTPMRPREAPTLPVSRSWLKAPSATPIRPNTPPSTTNTGVTAIRRQARDRTLSVPQISASVCMSDGMARICIFCNWLITAEGVGAAGKSWKGCAPSACSTQPKSLTRRPAVASARSSPSSRVSSLSAAWGPVRARKAAELKPPQGGQCRQRSEPRLTESGALPHFQVG